MNQETTPRRKKLLFVITKSNFGGAQRYVYDLATNLPRDRFDVAVAFGGTGATGSAPGALAAMLSKAGVRAIPLPALSRNVNIGDDLRAFRALIDLFKKESPDIVHLNSSKIGGLGALAARLTGVRLIIFTVHGWPFWEDRPAFARLIIFFLSYLTVLLSHYTICISAYDNGALGLMPFARRKIHIIHNGHSAFDLFERGEAREKLLPTDMIEAHQNDTWVITNAELHSNKNLLVGIDAIAAFNTSHQSRIFYCIMGDGEQRKEIERYITGKGLRDQVKLLGFVPDSRRYLHAFDIFFLPSKKEGVPYVLLEAAIAGIPVVASNVGGIPEIIKDGESGYLRASDDILGFTEALGTLAGDPSLRERMGKALEGKIASDFSLSTMLEQTILLY
ncbi:glycosyltransferase [Candidatus Kaiserbacteria bacterium]|nr:glycosyltransferase [Candidatus Kaiserbacteria bacterium]